MIERVLVNKYEDSLGVVSGENTKVGDRVLLLYYTIDKGIRLMAIGRKKPAFPKAKIGKKTGKKTKTELTKEESAMISRRNGKLSPINRPLAAYEKSDPMPLPEGSTDLADMYADIYDARAKVAPELKIQAVVCYMLTGTTKGVARMTGISHQTISEWKNKSQWWPLVLMKVKKDKQEELDAEITVLLHNSTAQLKDRLENGDEILMKDGGGASASVESFQKKLSGRDIANIINTLYDKRAMLRGDPTSISAKATSGDVLEELKSTFEKIAKTAYEQKVISSQ